MNFNFSYLDKLPKAEMETYCQGLKKEVNSLGVPIPCSRRIPIDKKLCPQCEKEMSEEKK